MRSAGLLLAGVTNAALIVALAGGFGAGPQAAVLAVLVLGAVVLLVEALWSDR